MIDRTGADDVTAATEVALAPAVVEEPQAHREARVARVAAALEQRREQPQHDGGRAALLDALTIAVWAATVDVGMEEALDQLAATARTGETRRMLLDFLAYPDIGALLGGR